MKRDTAFISALVFILCLSIHAWALQAADREVPRGPVTIEADTLSYDQANDTYQAQGNVIVFFTGGYLRADRLLLNRRTNEAVAEGNTVLKNNGDLLEGERVDFNTETKTGTVQSGRIFFEKYHFHIRGREIQKKGDADYFMKDGTATTCDGDCPDWQFAAREMDVTIDGYGTMKNGTFQILEVPVFYFPYLLFPVKTTRQSGVLLPHLGYSEEKLGFDVAVPVFWAISDSTDATFYQRYMDKRGYQQGAEYRYFLSPDSFGTFYADYLSDQWTGTREIEGVQQAQTEKEKRWSYYLNHQTQFDPGFYLRTDINRVSDNYYFNDFASYNYYLNHYAGAANRRFQRISYVGDQRLDALESKGRLVKDWGLLSLTGYAQYTDDFSNPSNDTTLQKYPEIRLNAFTQPLFGSPLNFGLGGSYSYNYRSVGEKGNLFDVFPVLSLPLSLGHYLQFTPEVGFRETYWDTSGALSGSEKKTGSRELITAGARLSSDVYRIFDVGGASIEKIKHYVKPELLYNYTAVQEDERPDFVTDINSQSNITWSLLNTLTSRMKDLEGKTSYQEFLRLKLFQIYDFRGDVYNVTTTRAALTTPTTVGTTPAGQGNYLGPLNAELDFYPYRYVTYNSTLSFDFNSGDLTAMNHTLGLSDNRGDSASIQYSYTKDIVENINLILKAKVTKEVELKYVVRNNLLQDTTLESTYGISYNRQCWGVEVAYSDLVNDRTFMVFINLLGLGRVGSASVKADALSSSVK
jgi:LPS-assembly protein